MSYKLLNKKIEPIEAPCNKAMHDSEEDALEEIRYLKEEKGVQNITHYYCAICNSWHLTTKKG